MTNAIGKLGIIGGNGALGSAIARGLLGAGTLSPAQIMISSRSRSLGGLSDVPGIEVVTDNQALADASDTILLAVPPAQAGKIGIMARDRLVISVMAGLTVNRLASLTGAQRIIRAMSSPAAARHLAYSPWVRSAGATPEDATRAEVLFSACGLTDEVQTEDQIDQFTAMTGPVPGFVAFFAECMEHHATARGIAPEVAARAIRQLFLAAGTMMEDAGRPAGEHVQEMIDYAGTTAAGLQVLRAGPIAEAISEGLDAAARKARDMGR
ncbi:MAG: NAD(P)-binding domain-containing protein [Rhodobacteraceae bacterium]|nr:NAD(P)-binding domain-containing protein [Paracoccaceae bacterium]